MKISGLILLAFATALLGTPAECQEPDRPAQSNCSSAQEPTQCELKAGIESYKNAHYQEAIEHFRRAVTLQPNLSKARLYLATALAAQFVPGVETHENQAYWEQAIAEFSTVIREGTREDALAATKAMGSLYFQMKKFLDAKTYFQKVIEIEPDDPEPYYTVAVIDWTESYSARMNAYKKLGIKPEEGQLDLGTCQRLAENHMPEVEEAMQMLVKALELRPDYDDAMAYMNLVYRERADLRCNDPAGREADIAEADKWVDATIAAKRARTRQSQGPSETRQ